MAVARPGIRREAGEDDIRPEAPDDAHHVPQYPVVLPEAQGLLGGLAEAEVHGRGEELLRPVDAPRGAQLLGPDGRQAVPQLGADEVLAAAAAGEGQVGGAQVAAPGQGGEHGGVLVVGVGGHIEHAAHGLQAVQLLQQVRRVPDRRLGPEAGQGQQPQGQKKAVTKQAHGCGLGEGAAGCLRRIVALGQSTKMGIM